MSMSTNFHEPTHAKVVIGEHCAWVTFSDGHNRATIFTHPHVAVALADAFNTAMAEIPEAAE